MKELSIEEKARRYDEAKLRMSAAYNDNRCTIGFMDEIFPELKESENEMIRKELLKAVKESEDSLHIVMTPRKRESLIAWLEKQGEQKPIDTKNLETAISNILKVYSHIILHRSLTQDELNETDVYAAENTKKLLCFLEQNPAEWSKEDEEIYKKVKTAINSYYAPFSRDAEEILKWFKSLKDRVQPQQEWSEEDEEMIDSIIGNIKYLYSIGSCDNATVDMKVNWLKSLSPHSEWKPSDGQMNAVKDAIDYLGCTKIVRKYLMSLYEYLKKLKG